MLKPEKLMSYDLAQ